MPAASSASHLIVDWIVGDLHLALAGHRVEKCKDGIRVFPAENIPNRPVLRAQVAELFVAMELIHAAIVVRFVLRVVIKADVDHHIHRI